MILNRATVFGSVVIALLLLCAAFAPHIATHDPYTIDLRAELLSPDRDHLLGTDQDGSDIFSRIVYGSRISIKVGLFTVLICGFAGFLLGSLSGFIGGWVDRAIMFVVDIFLAFPGILLAITVCALFREGSVDRVIFALCIAGWVPYCRLTRGEILLLREKEFILAAKGLGAGRMRIIFIHLLPNLLSPLVVQATFGMAGAIMAEAGLSFLGIGAPPGEPSWGSMLSQGRKYLLTAPHLSIYPGIAIMITVMAFNFLGDGIRDILDPKREKM